MKNGSEFVKIITKLSQIDAQEDLDKAFDSLDSFHPDTIATFSNLLIGTLVLNYEKHTDLAQKLIHFIKKKIAASPKLSLSCFFNIVSCKHVYKKLVSMEVLLKLLNDVIYQFDNNDFNKFNFYTSLLTQSCTSYELFCRNSLISLNQENIVSDGEIDFDKLKTKFLSGAQEKKDNWKYYISTINFINDLVALSDLLVNVYYDDRNKILKDICEFINEHEVPFVFVDLFGESEVKVVTHINLEYTFTLTTKSHVPFHILLELSNIDGAVPEKSSVAERPPENRGSTYEKNEENFLNSVEKKDENSSGKSGGGGFFSYFSLSNLLLPFYKCTSSYLPSKSGENYENPYPDSIGIFGKKKFSEIELKTKGCHFLPLIIKSSEDLRQDIFVSQIIEILVSIFEEENLSLFLKPIDIVSSSHGGMTKTLVDTTSLSKINKIDYSAIDGYSSSTIYIDPVVNPDKNWSKIKNYFSLKFGNDSKVIDNFVSSLAGYSLLCYLLEIKDRNNGNILIDDEGHLIHIDFGFLLNCSPGNVNFEQAPFKLTQDFIELIGGVDSDEFKKFKKQFIDGFLAIRKETDLINLFISLFFQTNSDLPCFASSSEITEKIRGKFLCSCTNEDELVSFAESLITSSINSWRTKIYDSYQKFCVGIS